MGYGLVSPPLDLQKAFAVWWEAEYKDLRLDGFLANSVQPWRLLAAPVSLAVRDPEHTPYCSASSDPRLSQVLLSSGRMTRLSIRCLSSGYGWVSARSPGSPRCRVTQTGRCTCCRRAGTAAGSSRAREGVS